MHMHWLKGLTAQAQLHVLVRVILKSRSIVSCPIALSLGVLDNPPRFPDVLVTELGATCADPRGAPLFGRTAEQSPLTGYEPNGLVEISCEYTPINFPSRRNSF